MMGNAGYSAYVAANSGITGMTRAHARELGPDKIRVNAIGPGWVLTQKQLDMWATPEGLAGHLERQCLKEHLAPEDIVNPCLFLLWIGAQPTCAPSRCRGARCWTRPRPTPA